MSKTNIGLVEYAKAQLGKPYWYGCFGQIASEALYNTKKKQYPSFYTANDYHKQYGQRVHDCIGLIKGYLWSKTPMSEPLYNPSQDVSADGILAKCKEKGNISTIPELPGVLVFSPQHVGVYIGNGYVVEARGHKYGVVKTKLSERSWKSWGKCPWIEYEESKKTTTAENLVLSFQQAALADDKTLLPQYGADGEYGSETAAAMKVCVVKRRLVYKYKNCTKLVQRLLGFTGNDIDGKCGSKTSEAIKKFQQENQLEVDGSCGPKTWEKLLKIK